ncbi:MAG: hypothetical protein M1608_02235 [Candidatus Omnitrophica bacterium]|nr:hypothetical protein [Candidatus Omnitrophota bacterium]
MAFDTAQQPLCVNAWDPKEDGDLKHAATGHMEQGGSSLDAALLQEVNPGNAQGLAEYGLEPGLAHPSGHRHISRVNGFLKMRSQVVYRPGNGLPVHVGVRFRLVGQAALFPAQQTNQHLHQQAEKTHFTSNPGVPELGDHFLEILNESGHQIRRGSHQAAV